MTRLHLSKNGLLSKEGGRALGDILKANTTLKELEVSGSGNGMEPGVKDGPGFVTAISEGLAGNMALTKFDISENRLCAEGGKILAAGLKGNIGITELNIATTFLGIEPNGQPDISGVVALADVIKDMGGISTFTFSGDDEESEPVTMETSMVEADFSKKGLGVSGAIIVGAFLPKCT
jgi:hypothetical protein